MPYINVKWPNLLVVGDPVTREQAAQILIRTRPDYLFCNVPGYGDVVSKMLESAPKLMYLDYTATDRIMSCWTDGVKGWCDWNGHIGCSNYNIGKWPTVDEVTEELTKIAEAFPFLRMTVQVLDREHCEDDGAPTAEWRVEDGSVELREPGLMLDRDPHTSYVSEELAAFRKTLKTWRDCEIGITYRELEEVLKHV